MAFISGDRESRQLFPPSIADYVSETDPVRAYDAIIDTLVSKGLELKIEEKSVGAPSYDPVSMLKLLVYGYSYGVRSSRKLERACHHNLSFIYLMGGLKPDHKTIAKFRRDNKDLLKGVLRSCAHICIELNLIAGNVLFVDGSKFRANANIGKKWNREKCQKKLEYLKARIDELLSQCEKIDAQEDAVSSSSYVEVKKELADKKNLKKKLEEVITKLDEAGLDEVNRTDSDCVKIHGRQGTHAGYNSQVVTDEKCGLIVHNEVIAKSNDHNQFSSQIAQAEEVTGKEAEIACGDGGYSQVEDLKEIHERGTMGVVPSRKHSSRKGLGPFDKENFKYDEEKNEYICPAEQRLRYNRFVAKDNAYEYIIKDRNACPKCNHFGICTKSKNGRRVQRHYHEKLKEEFDKIYESEDGQRIYSLRKEKAELPFGHIKRNLGAGYFLLRGLDGVNAEMSILSTCFNISRMISLVGVPELIKKLA